MKKKQKPANAKHFVFQVNTIIQLYWDTHIADVKSAHQHIIMILIMTDILMNYNYSWIFKDLDFFYVTVWKNLKFAFTVYKRLYTWKYLAYEMLTRRNIHAITLKSIENNKRDMSGLKQNNYKLRNMKIK